MSVITGRDIFSKKEWDVILEKSDYDADDVTIKELTQAIASYHQLEKTNQSTIPGRQAALKKIAHLCMDYIEKTNATTESQKNKKKLGDDFIVWIISLQRKSKNKYQYLEKLNQFLCNAKLHHIDRNQMIEHLKNRNQSNTCQRLKLFSGTYLEKIDPLHRQYEFNMNTLPNFGKGMNQAFIDWVNSNEDISFFLWLENHPIMTQNNVLNANEKVSLIHYQLETVHIASIANIDGDSCIVSKEINSTEDATKLNTRKMKLFCHKMGNAYGSTAFVWSKENENMFLTHPHEAGKYHHSSLTAGKSVRCAGMWCVNNGLITHISNSSGHYRPSSLSFYLLIKFLADKNVINDATKVADMRKPLELRDPLQPFAGVKSPYISLSDYIAWAENLPDIKEHLARTSASIVVPLHIPNVANKVGF